MLTGSRKLAGHCRRTVGVKFVVAAAAVRRLYNNDDNMKFVGYITMMII